MARVLTKRPPLHKFALVTEGSDHDFPLQTFYLKERTLQHADPLGSLRAMTQVDGGAQEGASPRTELSKKLDSDVISIDDLLERELGFRGWGPAQWLLLFVGGLAYISTGMTMFTMSFTVVNPLLGSAAATPSWRCTTSSTSTSSSTSDTACMALMQPPGWQGPSDQPQQQQQQGGHRRQLLRLAADVVKDGGFRGAEDEGDGPMAGEAGGAEAGVGGVGLCGLGRGEWTWLRPADSIVTEFDLVCGQEWKASLVETTFFLGFMCGNMLFGTVTDRWGRRSTLLLCSAATALLTLLSAWPAIVPRGTGVRMAARAADGGGGGGGNVGFWVHLVLRSLTGSAAAGQALAGYVIATEMVGPAWRGAAGMLTQTFYILGEFLLVAASLALPAWRPLTAAVATAAVATLAGAVLVPESPRWLLLNGRPDQAYAAFRWIARLNRRPRAPPVVCTRGGEVRLLLGCRLRPLPRTEGSGPGALELAGPGAAGGSGGARGGGGGSDAAYGGAADGDGWGAVMCGGEDDVGWDERTPLVCVVSSSGTTGSGGGDLQGQGTRARECVYSSRGQAQEGNGNARQGPCSPGHGEVDSGARTTGAEQLGEGGSEPSVGVAAAAAGAGETLLTALRHPATRPLLLSCCFIMFALSIAYFGVTLALGALAGSLHLNFFLTALAELPGYLAIAATTDRVGRRLVMCGGTGLAGLACVACAFTAEGPLQVLLAVVGKLGCSGAWAVGLTFASELFPTSLRSAALAVSSQSGDLGGLVTPGVLLLGGLGGGRPQQLPFLVMGLTSMAAVAVAATLPETRGMPQLETFPELLAWLDAWRAGAKSGRGAGGGEQVGPGDGARGAGAAAAGAGGAGAAAVLARDGLEEATEAAGGDLEMSGLVERHRLRRSA